MATLSARGRTELARVERHLDLPNSEDLHWECIAQVLMSDGNILEKRTVKFRFDDRRHTWGWKRVVKCKLTPEQFIAMMEKSGFKKIATRKTNGN